MTGERKKEIKNCLQLLLLEQSSKTKENGEIICCVLFFQYYLSVLFEKQAGKEISFAALYDRVEKGRFQWSFYEKWMKNFCDFLYLITGRQEAVELFDFVEFKSQKEEQRALERFLRKGIRCLFQLNLTKEEGKECLELFLELFYQKEEEKNGIPKELVQSLAKILIQEQKQRSEKCEPVLFGSGEGNLLVALKYNNPFIQIKAEETRKFSNGLARMICFAMDPEKRWVLEPEENRIEIGISLWPFGTTEERDVETFSSACLSSHKGPYQNLGVWLSELTETGVFYFLCFAGFLYREGKEKSLRRYLIEEKNYLDGIFLLPDSLWKPGFPEIVLLCFRKGRTKAEPIYLLDVSGEDKDCMDEWTEYFLQKKGKESIACLISKEQIEKQDMNLNPARYLYTEHWKNFPSADIEVVKKRLLEIETRLEEIEKQRKMYLLELTLDLPVNKKSV